MSTRPRRRNWEMASSVGSTGEGDGEQHLENGEDG